MGVILESEAEALDWCRRIRQAPLNEAAQMIMAVERIDCSRLPAEVCRTIDDAFFFVVFGYERRQPRKSASG